jgi:hypothetical protein
MDALFLIELKFSVHPEKLHASQTSSSTRCRTSKQVAYFLGCLIFRHRHFFATPIAILKPVATESTGVSRKLALRMKGTMEFVQQAPSAVTDARAFMTEQCSKAEEMIRRSWKRGAKALDAAAMSIDCQLEGFLLSLDEDPLFARMPPADHDFHYLWMLFLHWGKPEAIWDDEGCRLMGLSLEDICVAFASSQIKTARFMLSDAAEHPQGWTRAAANDLAARHIRAVDAALAFLARQTSRR